MRDPSSESPPSGSGRPARHAGSPVVAGRGTGGIMRIGLVAPPWVPVPPTRYGGTESILDNLARGLVDRGHDVVLFTVGASTCPVERRWLFEEPAEPIGAGEPEAAHVLA